MYPPPPQSASSPYYGGASGPRAGFWRRFAALFVDGLIVAIVPIILIAIGGGASSKALVVLGYLLLFFGGIAYEIYFIGSTGQTLGKQALGIRVIDFNTGGSIGYGRATIRWIGRIISAFICYLGYFWMLWDKEKQCWHDKMANDVVVPVEFYPVS